MGSTPVECTTKKTRKPLGFSAKEKRLRGIRDSLILTKIGVNAPFLALFCTFHVSFLSLFSDPQRDRRNELRSQAFHRSHFDFQPTLQNLLQAVL